MNSKRNDLTQGVIWKKLMLFFLPVAAGTLIQQTYNAVDAAIVGKYVGTTALAAVGGSVSHILNVMVGFFIAMTAGSSVIISHFYGSKDLEKVGAAARTGISFCNIIGLVVTVIGILGSRTMLRWMGTPAETIDDAEVYLKLCFAAAWAVLIYNMGAGILRASGDSRRPFIYLASCALTNIVLDLVFVVGFDMGVAGAAIATSLSQFVSAGLVLLRLYTADEPYRLQFKPFSINGLILSRMMKIGIPSGLQSSMYSVSNMLVQVGVNSLGATFVAAWSLTGKLDGFYWAIMTAVGTSVISFVGQNYGAGDFARIRESVRVSLRLFMVFTVITMGVFTLGGKLMLALFTNDTALIDLTYHVLMYFVPFYIIWTVIEIHAGALRGAGDATAPVIYTGIFTCLLRVIWVATVFRMAPSIECLCWCYPLTWVLTCIPMVLRYRSEKWLPEQFRGQLKKS
ncbi:MAG: MATE family efflux transporter [Firmicutes bacterium]|nr:MATE family efflux transporter [Bacillota bacterium]